jgi:hypothetical protein
MSQQRNHTVTRGHLLSGLGALIVYDGSAAHLPEPDVAGAPVRLASCSHQGSVLTKRPLKTFNRQGGDGNMSDLPTTVGRVLGVLSDGDWHTAAELAGVSGSRREWLRELELSGYGIEQRNDNYFRLHTPQAESNEPSSTAWLAGPDGAMLGLPQAFACWVPRARIDDGPTAAIGGKHLYYPQRPRAVLQTDTAPSSRSNTRSDRSQAHPRASVRR